MEGVFVLTTQQVYTALEGTIVGIGTFIVIVCVVVALAMLDESLEISCIFLALTVVFIIFCFRIPRSETQYKVVVEDCVSWKELTERYKVVKIEGKIVTLIEKEQKED